MRLTAWLTRLPDYLVQSSQPLTPSMLRRLQWVAVIIPLLFVGAVENTRHFYFDRYLPAWASHAVTVVILSIGTFLFANHVFKLISQAHLKIVRLLAEGEARRKEAEILKERDRLARELHDGLAQRLAFINIALEAFKGKEQLPKDDQRRLGELSQVVDEAYSDLRQAIYDLRSFDLENDFLSWLRQYVETFARRNGLKYSMAIKPPGPSFPAQIEIHLVRVVQEILSNVHKHARARRVEVKAEESEGTLSLEIADDGVGMRGRMPKGERTAEHHWGFRILQERMNLIGGQVSIQSAPDDGTRVRLWVPLHRRGDTDEEAIADHGRGRSRPLS